MDFVTKSGPVMSHRAAGFQRGSQTRFTSETKLGTE